MIESLPRQPDATWSILSQINLQKWQLYPEDERYDRKGRYQPGSEKTALPQRSSHGWRLQRRVAFDLEQVHRVPRKKHRVET